MCERDGNIRKTFYEKSEFSHSTAVHSNYRGKGSGIAWGKGDTNYLTKA